MNWAIEFDTNILLTVLFGIGIPIITFYITYKKTVGAKNERKRTANRDIVSIMAKLIAHEQINPNFDMINGLIRSKSREYDVNIDASSIPLIFEDVMTKFIENEFISQDIKKNLIDKVQLIQNETFESKETKEATVSIQEVSLLSDKSPIVLSTIVTLIVTLGSIITISITILKGQTFPLTFSSEMLPSVIIAMISLIFVISFAYKMKYEEIKASEMEKTKYAAPIFEEMVLSALEKIMPKEYIDENVFLGPGLEVDFLLNINDEKIPIEVKYRTVQPISIIQIKNFVTKLNTKKAILITNSSTTLKIQKLAEENSITLIDEVQSEEDIIKKLKPIIS